MSPLASGSWIETQVVKRSPPANHERAEVVHLHTIPSSNPPTTADHAQSRRRIFAPAPLHTDPLQRMGPWSPPWDQNGSGKCTGCRGILPSKGPCSTSMSLPGSWWSPQPSRHVITFFHSGKCIHFPPAKQLCPLH